MGKEEHVSGSPVSYLWLDSKVFPSIYSCTSEQVPVGLLHFALGYEPPGRLWNPPAGARRGDCSCWSCLFSTHIYGSGIFSTRFQLNITTVVHGKNSGAPFWHVHALLPLSWSFKLLSIKTGPGELLFIHLCFLGLFKIWNCQISKLQCRKDSVRSIHTLLVAKMLWFSQKSKPSALTPEFPTGMVWDQIPTIQCLWFMCPKSYDSKINEQLVSLFKQELKMMCRAKMFGELVLLKVSISYPQAYNLGKHKEGKMAFCIHCHCL